MYNSGKQPPELPVAILDTAYSFFYNPEHWYILHLHFFGRRRALCDCFTVASARYAIQRLLHRDEILVLTWQGY
jgi:hypothetical protein